MLAWASEAVHGVGILHGINALVILGLTGSLVFREWRRPGPRPGRAGDVGGVEGRAAAG